MKADVGNADGTSREAAEDDLFGIDVVVFDETGDDEFGVVCGGLFVSPPRELVLFSVLADEGKIEPDCLTGGESVAEGGVFNFPSGAGGWVFIAGVFDDEGEGRAVLFPLWREVKSVVDLGAFVFGQGDFDSFSGGG